MDVEIRPITGDEVETFMRVTAAAFHANPTAEQVDEGRVELPELDRALGAFVGARIVGTAGDLAVELTLPGGRIVPMAGISWVGVLPTHRRQGVLRALMRHQLDSVRDRGEALAGLTASEGGIYGRFGYGPATWHVAWELRRSQARFRAQAGDQRVELVSEDDAGRLLPPLQDRARRDRWGDIKVANGWWEQMLASRDRGREGTGAKLFAVHRGTDGEVDGGAVYRVPWVPDEAGMVRVDHLVATTPTAYAALWALLADLDLTEMVVARHRPLDEPLRFLLDDPRQPEVRRVGDNLWVRLVDLPAALVARRYGAEGAMVLEVADDMCPWNKGRWHVEVGPEGADCRRAAPGEEADLALSTAALASTYLGGMALPVLAYAGQVAELRPGAVARVAAFLRTDVTPHSSTSF